MISREELFERLDMESPEDFSYFEQFADLMETQDEIDFDDFYVVLSKIPGDDLAEINENYFQEMEKSFPDGHDDFMEVLQTAWNSLSLLLKDLDREEYRKEFVDQLYKFHEMYVNPEGASIDGKPASVMGVLADSRASKIDNEEHNYEFENSMDFQPDYISMGLDGFEGEYDESNFTE